MRSTIGRRAHPFACYLTLLAVATVTWVAFRPALMSPDSFAQYREALSGQFTDWHSPAMSLLIRLAILAGAGLSGLMWLQSLAMTVGVFYLARTSICLWIGDHPSPSFATRAATGIVLILMLPIAPLPFYLMTLWKDAWLLVVFLWIGAIALHLWSSAAVSSLRSFGGLLAALVVLMAMALLLRHNAVLLIVPFGVLLALLIRRRSGVRRSVYLLLPAPAVIALAFSSLLSSIYPIERSHPEQSVMALDLVGMIIRDPALCSEFPVTCSQLRSDHELRYAAGDVTPLIWTPDSILPVDFVTPRRNPALRAEYSRAVRRHPVALATIKVDAYLRLLTASEQQSFQTPLGSNEFDLQHPVAFEPIRWLLVGVASRVTATPLRWLFGVHMVWLCVGLARLALAAHRIRRGDDPRERLMASVLAILVIYALSFLFATVAIDYRYFYPATLLIQVLILSEALAWCTRWRFARTGVEANPSAHE